MTALNAELAYRVIDQIHAHRRAFSMADWWDDRDDEPVTLENLTGEKCGTTACFAGWAIALSGYTLGGGVSLNGQVVSFTYGDFAQEILGLNDDEASYLFYVNDDEIDHAVHNVFGQRPEAMS